MQGDPQNLVCFLLLCFTPHSSIFQHVATRCEVRGTWQEFISICAGYVLAVFADSILRLKAPYLSLASVVEGLPGGRRLEVEKLRPQVSFVGGTGTWAPFYVHVD